MFVVELEQLIVMKDIVDINYKFLVNGGKWSFLIVCCVCGMDLFKWNSNGSESFVGYEENVVLKFLLCLQLVKGKQKDINLEELKFLLVFFQRKDSSEKC